VCYHRLFLSPVRSLLKKNRLLKVLAILERESSPHGERASAAQRVAELLLSDPALVTTLRAGIAVETEDASEAVHKELSRVRMALQEAEFKIAELERGRTSAPSMRLRPGQPTASPPPPRARGGGMPLPPSGIRDAGQWWAHFSRDTQPPFFSAGLFARLPGAPGGQLHAFSQQLSLGTAWVLEDSSGRPWMVSELRPTNLDEVCRFGALLFSTLGTRLVAATSPTGQRRQL
jgi:hypothetical protein